MEPNEHDRNDGFDVTSINRRKVLQGVGAASAIGVLGTGHVAAEDDEPCFKDFECSDDGTYVKFEFVEEDTNDDGVIDKCYFEEETDTDLITIDSYTSKEEGDCEPISVEWSVADGYGANKVMAYGGQDCVSPEDPDPDPTFEPELEGPGGKTAAISNLQFCVEKLETVELPVDDVYIGYEDRPASGDFDYNDFGMDANITETYLDNELQTIELEFTSRVYKAGDDHLIHIQRDVPDGVEWDYTLSRSGTTEVVTNDVTQPGSDSGNGDLDLTLFDTGPLSNGDSTDATVTATVEITSGSVSPPTDSPRPDEAADNPLFEVYDPYMENTSQSSTIDLGTVQSGVNKSATGWDETADVPNIVVIPVTDFTPPDEQVTITNEYPDFDNYYAGEPVGNGEINVDTGFADWFNP